MNQFLEIALNELQKFGDNQKEWQKRILEDWGKTYDMPRKMKKRRRKELLLDWSFANYNPFEE